jgi:4-diphosphocytidyl-2-C-methyl-D-erythritol kinase
VPTPAVFKEFDAGYGPSPLGLEPFPNGASPMTQEDFAGWILGQRNDLTKVVAEDKFAPVITNTILPRLRGAIGCVDTDMSGSGSTCWAWFADEDDAVAASAALATEHSEWWVVAAPVLDRKSALS